jgi:alpha-galactosidase
MKRIISLVAISFMFLSISAQKFDQLAKTPPMGWNSWNKYGCNVSETMIMGMADAIVSSGMKDAG